MGKHANVAYLLRGKVLLVIGGFFTGLLLTECLMRLTGLAELDGGIKYRYNERGLRGPNQENKGLILSLGDSVTFGQGVRFEETFSYRLDEALGAAHVVLNAGLPGRNTVEEYEYFVAVGGKPKVLLLQLSLNDAEQESYSYLTLTPWSGFEKRWLWRSHMFFYLVIAYSAVAHPYETYIQDLYREGAPGLAGFTTALDAIAVVCRNRGIIPILVIFPMLDDLEDYAYDDIHQRLAGLGSRSGYRVVDLLGVFRDSIPPAGGYKVSISDSHPNAEAHALAAKTLTPVLRDALAPGPP